MYLCLTIEKLLKPNIMIIYQVHKNLYTLKPNVVRKTDTYFWNENGNREKLIGFKEFDFSIEFLTKLGAIEKSYTIGKKDLSKIEFTKFFENLEPVSKLLLKCIIKTVE